MISGRVSASSGTGLEYGEVAHRITVMLGLTSSSGAENVVTRFHDTSCRQLELLRAPTRLSTYAPVSAARDTGRTVVPRSAVGGNLRAEVDLAGVVAHRQGGALDVDGSLADGEDMVEPLVGFVVGQEGQDVQARAVGEVR